MNPKANQIAAAYVLDRAYQYRESSGIHHALIVVACALWDGEAEAAHAHGELDDVIKGMASRRGERTKGT